MAHGQNIYLGIDVGTSGVRGMAIDATGAVVAQASAPLPPRNVEYRSDEPVASSLATNASVKLDEFLFG